jgi:hypothetical protein
MGLSVADLRARPALVDTLLTYHVIPRKLTGECQGSYRLKHHAL